MQKNCFVIKNCVKTDYKTKKKRILLSQFYYKVGKNKGSIFFQSVCEAAVLHIAFLYSLADRKNGYLISCCGKEEKNVMMCKKNNQ